jgi:hypothetical protein
VLCFRLFRLESRWDRVSTGTWSWLALLGKPHELLLGVPCDWHADTVWVGHYIRLLLQLDEVNLLPGVSSILHRFLVRLKVFLLLREGFVEVFIGLQSRHAMLEDLCRLLHLLH